MDMVSVDRQALTEFAELMETLTDGIAEGRDNQAFAYAGTEPGNRPLEKWRAGVKVTLGAVEYPHSGRMAGERMADLVGAGMENLISIEEGSRALASIARAILDQLDTADQIAAGDLDAIMRFCGIPTSTSLKDLLKGI